MEYQAWGVKLKKWGTGWDTVQALLIYYSEQWFTGWEMLLDGNWIVFFSEISPYASQLLSPKCFFFLLGRAISEKPGLQYIINTHNRGATFATFIIPQHLLFLCSLTHFTSLSIRSVSHLQNHLRGTVPLVHNPLSTQGANNSSWSLFPLSIV